ncbi:GTP cyclohydrolase I [Kitasatospora cineracea]
MSTTLTIPVPVPVPGTAAAPGTGAAPAARPPIDTGRVAAIVRSLLVELGQDPDRAGLAQTPDRVARYLAEFLDHDPGRIDTVFEHQARSEGCVAVGGIRTTSLCEHHLLPFTVEAHVAYRPAGRVLGLSKLVRITHKHAHALQLQERLGDDILREVAELTGSTAVAVWLVGEHSCMTARGVSAHGSRTATEHLTREVADDPEMTERLRRVALMAGGAR